jgi:hypothetical protein
MPTAQHSKRTTPAQLAQRIATPAAAAIIEIAKSQINVQLLAALQQRGLHAVPIDEPAAATNTKSATGPIKNKATLLNALQTQGGFPAFGNNWDALHDLLTDFAWLNATPKPAGYVLLFRNAATLRKNAPADYATFLEVFRASAADLAQTGALLRLVLGK